MFELQAVIDFDQLTNWIFYDCYQPYNKIPYQYIVPAAPSLTCLQSAHHVLEY